MHHLHEHILEVNLQNFQFQNIDMAAPQLAENGFNVSDAFQREHPVFVFFARLRPEQRIRQAIR